jgi:type IV secretory pathway TrbD component
MPDRFQPMIISPSSPLAGFAYAVVMALGLCAAAVVFAANGAPIWLVAPFGIGAAWLAYLAVVQWHSRNNFIVELHDEQFRFRTYKGEIREARYCDIVGVEENCSAKWVDGLSLQMENGAVNQIFVGLSPKDSHRVFQELRERSPQLRQPYSTIQRLRAVR